MTKCLKCGAVLNQIHIEPLEMIDGAGQGWNGVTYNCPYCYHAISAGIDPVSLKNDIVTEILAALRRG